MNFITWFIIWDVITSQGEWIELPKLDPFSKPEKVNIQKIPFVEKIVNESKNKIPVTLDFNLEQVLLQVHKTLAAEGQGHTTIDKKDNFLKTIQKRLLSEIWSRSHTIWATTGIEGRGHGHVMTFPSLEGALMTISFLTFAVFLIKIVKQFIQGLQGANGNVVGIELPGTMVTPSKVIKHKRSPGHKGKKTEKSTECSNLKATEVCKKKE